VNKIEKSDLRQLSHTDQVRFALFCAYQCKKGWENIPKCMEAIKVTELWLEGKVAAKECRGAAITASYAAYTAYTAAHAAFAAAEVAYTVDSIAPWSSAYDTAIRASSDLSLDKDRVIQEQWNYFYELRDFDKIAEQILIGG
jgi:hypothetical protein